MAEHPNVELVRRLNTAMASGDVATVEAGLADDVVWHEIGLAQPRRGRDALRSEMGAADYQISWELHDVVGNDEHVVALGTATATRGDRSLTYRTAEIYHVRGGRVVERWAFSDDTQAIVDFFR